MITFPLNAGVLLEILIYISQNQIARYKVTPRTLFKDSILTFKTNCSGVFSWNISDQNQL